MFSEQSRHGIDRPHIVLVHILVKT